MTQQPLELVGSEPDGPDRGTEDAGDRLPPGFVRAVVNDSRLTDMLMDALEARVVALEEVAAARGLRRLAWHDDSGGRCELRSSTSTATRSRSAAARQPQRSEDRHGRSTGRTDSTNQGIFLVMPSILVKVGSEPFTVSR